VTTTATGDGLGDLTEAVRALTDPARDTPAGAKACCAAVWGLDLVRLFLGESYHPGGVELTRRLATLLDLRPGERVLDVAAGIGTTALLLAAERAVHVTGVDLGTAQVARARARAAEAGLGGLVRFDVGDAEGLPFPPGAFDAVVCECAFCTFPDKPTAASEMRRVVAPGGRVGIADVWIEPEHLDPDLRGLAGRVACLADARPIDELRAILEAADLRVTTLERHDEALAATIEQVRDRLRALRLLDLPPLRGFDLRRAVAVAGQAAEAVRRGDAGYVLVVARAR
jgi:SAM-dependent methyltransferase